MSKKMSLAVGLAQAMAMANHVLVKNTVRLYFIYTVLCARIVLAVRLTAVLQASVSY